MKMVKITRGQVPSITKKILKEQDGICPLCLKPIYLDKKGSYALDHNHLNGVIRGVLHKSCNAAEGKVRWYVGRLGTKKDDYEAIILWLERLILYLKTRTSQYIHYTFFVGDEKKEHDKLKRRKAYALKKAKLAVKDNRK